MSERVGINHSQICVKPACFFYISTCFTEKKKGSFRIKTKWRAIILSWMRLYTLILVMFVCHVHMRQSLFKRDYDLTFNSHDVLQWKGPRGCSLPVLTFWWWENWTPEKRSKLTLSLSAEIRTKITRLEEVVRKNRKNKTCHGVLSWA